MIWLVVEPTPLKNMKINWDDELPNIWENESHVPKHQPDREIHGKIQGENDRKIICLVVSTCFNRSDMRKSIGKMNDVRIIFPQIPRNHHVFGVE